MLSISAESEAARRVKTYFNLGCGQRFHPDWTNIDMIARGPGVIVHDLNSGIPAAAESVEVVYHAAVFEHIRRKDVPQFLHEIYRVLKPGGIVRIGVPDLEKICRLYLQKLEAVLAGDKQAESDYDWIVLEMLDQMIREKSGGDMVDYLRRVPLPNEQFVYERIGQEGRELVERIRREKANITTPSRRSFFGSMRALARKMRNRLLIFCGGTDTLSALEIGRFRLSGEAHQWMYDRFSLARELIAAGFCNPMLRAAGESAIPNWTGFNLDVRPDGTLNKPDLFFMEANKPGEATG